MQTIQVTSDKVGALLVHYDDEHVIIEHGRKFLRLGPIASEKLLEALHERLIKHNVLDIEIGDPTGKVALTLVGSLDFLMIHTAKVRFNMHLFPTGMSFYHAFKAALANR